MTMGQKLISPFIRLFPSLTDLAFLFPVIFMFTAMGGAKALLQDGDTGWHIRTGEWILSNARVPKSDIFSYTKFGERWFAWEWGSDVIFGWLHLQFGLAGVVVLGMLVLCSTSALIFLLISRRCSDRLIAITVTFVVVSATTIHWHARPHLFTMLFTALFLYLIDVARNEHPRAIWGLPLLTMVWTNLHGGFIVGIALLVCYAVGELVPLLFEPRAGLRAETFANSERYLLVAGGCIAASLFNPFTYHLHLFIASYLRAPFLERVSEFMAPNFRLRGSWSFEALLFAALIFTFWNLRRGRYAEAMMTLAWAHLSLFAQRNIPIFALVCAPALAQSLDEWTSAMSEYSGRLGRAAAGFKDAVREFGDIDRMWRVHAVGASVFLAACLGMMNPSATGRFRAEFDPKQFPKNAVDHLGDQVANARIFTEDQWGDYLIYRRYPSVRVYVDGRSDFYGNEFMLRYCDTIGAQHGWEQDFDRYGVDKVLLPVNSPLVGALKRSPAWKPVFDDHRAIVFDRLVSREKAQQVPAGRQPEPGSGRTVAGYGRDVTVTANPKLDTRIEVKQSL
jgi:hypothetical protein